MMLLKSDCKVRHKVTFTSATSPFGTKLKDHFMCGIFGMVSNKKRPVNQEILTALKTLEYRGYDSWGLAYKNDRGLAVVKRIGKIGDTVLSEKAAANIGIGHTRWATHGGVTVHNAHPHLSFDGRFALVHNGIVENFLKLKRLLLKNLPDLSFKSETDSEVIVHLMAYYAKKYRLRVAFGKTIEKLEGLNAIVILDKKTDQLLVYKQGSPLVLAKTKEGIFVASDLLALLPYSQKFYFFDDGEALVGEELFTLTTGKSKKFLFKQVDVKAQELSKNGFDFFMEKEIHEAPELIDRLLSTFSLEQKKIVPLLFEADELALIGCGTAYYAALVGQYLLAEVGRAAHSYSGGEVGHFLPNFKAGTLSVFLSQSGETIDLIEQTTRLKKQKQKFIAIVNRSSSTLDRQANASLHLQAGPEISVVSTKAFLAKLIVWLLLTASLGDELEKSVELLKKTKLKLKKTLNKASCQKISNCAKLIKNESRVFVLGRGAFYPLALECALKAKEAAYMHFEGFAGGELKHGVIALLEPGTWTIVLLGGNHEDKDLLSNAWEIKARGGKIIGISPTFELVFDIWLDYDDAGQANLLQVAVIVQLLGLYLAKVKNLDPDKPRNLAKSVTVK